MSRERYKQFETTELRYGGRWTCVHCPVQADGRLPDGRPWYFRARSGDWSLRVGKPGDEDAVGGEWIAEGLDPWGGFMPAPEAARRIHNALDWHVNGQRTALTGCVGTGEVLARCLDGYCLADLRKPSCTSNDAVLAAGEANHG